jgi:hypothetical protein
VSFKKILNDMVVSTHGSIAAVFLDYEGETVEVLSNGLSVHDVKVIGAYQGIFFTRLRNLCERIEAGRIDRFKFDFPDAKILSVDLGDGYYVTLVVRHESNEGVAWQHLDACRARLRAEIL